MSAIRTQTRHTSTPGDPVPDSLWIIDSDSGAIPIPGGGKLPVASVAASGAEAANPASNAIDGNLATRWSSFGKGQWIELDLGTSANISEVDVAWFKGDQRTSHFIIDVSEGAASTLFFSGTSSGKTLQFEKYNGIATGSKVRITVNGNSQNDWASITEIQVIGSIGPPPADVVTAEDISVTTPQDKALNVTPKVTLSNPEAKVASVAVESQAHNGTAMSGTAGDFLYTPNTAFNGMDSFKYSATDNMIPANKSNTATVSVAVGTAPPPTNVDVFGITKLYGDRAGPYNNWDMRDTSRYYEQTPKPLGNGWFTAPNLTQMRIEVLPVAGLKDTDIDTYWMDDLIKRGYTHLPEDDPSGHGDFGDCEMTVRLRNVGLGHGSYESHLEFVFGTFRQSTNTGKAGKDGRVVISCEAGSYHCNWYYGGNSGGSNRAKYERDYKHTDGYSTNDPEFHGVVGIDGKAEHVIKAVYYRVPNPNVPGSGGFEAHLETYLSVDGGKTFRRIASFVDHGQWGPSKGGVASSCGYKSEFQPITNAKCAPGLREDFMTSVEFKDWSIRSIDRTKMLVAV